MILALFTLKTSQESMIKIERLHLTSRSVYFMQKLNMIMCTQNVHIAYAEQCQETIY